MTFGLALLGGFLWWAEGQFAWIAMRAAPGQRIAALAGVVVVGAVLYFGALAAAGMRPADLKRGG